MHLDTSPKMQSRECDGVRTSQSVARQRASFLLRETPRKVVDVLRSEKMELRTREIARRAGLDRLDVGPICRRLAMLGLVSERKRRVRQRVGDKSAYKILSYWTITDECRDMKLIHPSAS